MNSEGGGEIGVVVTVSLLLLVNLLLAEMTTALEEAILDGNQNRSLGVRGTKVTWKITLMTIAVVVTHHSVLDHPADQGVVQSIPTPLIPQVVLGRGQDQGPYLIRPHFLPQGVVIENIAVTVEDTVVEAKVAVAVEIEITEGDHPKVRGVTTIIVGEVEVTQEIAEGGNNSINDRGRVPNRPIH
jgi:hypothetical protein